MDSNNGVVLVVYLTYGVVMVWQCQGTGIDLWLDPVVGKNLQWLYICMSGLMMIGYAWVK